MWPPGAAWGFGENDWLVSWKLGSKGGVSWAVADDLDAPWWSSILAPSKNEYAGDVFINILLYSKATPLPQDVNQLHGLRRLYYEYDVQSSLDTGLVEFAERLGANGHAIYAKLDEADRVRRQSFEKYRDYRFAEATDLARAACSRLSELNSEALKLKDRALFWIYATEWASITPTALLGGLVLWTLMIRRRLHRETSTTRFSKVEGYKPLSWSYTRPPELEKTSSFPSPSSRCV